MQAPWERVADTSNEMSSLEVLWKTPDTKGYWNESTEQTEGDTFIGWVKIISVCSLNKIIYIIIMSSICSYAIAKDMDPYLVK